MIVWIEGSMLFLMVGALAGGLHNRWQKKRGIGDRFIQFVGVAWLIGATVILALEMKLEGTPGTLLGALAGYLFGMQRPQKPRAKRSEQESAN